MVIRFPDGSKEFWLPGSMPEPGDVVWRSGDRYVIESVTWDGLRGVATTIGSDVEAHVKDPPVLPPPSDADPA